MIRIALIPILLALPVTGLAQQVPAAVIDSCLLFDRSSDASISISPIEGGESLIDEVTVPGYQLFTPGGDSNKLRIGYATKKRGSNDYIFVGTRRGFIMQAIAVSKFQPTRVEEQSLAAYAVLRQGGQRYVCVIESNGNGSAAFVRSAFVGRIPLSKGATLKLFYKVADVKKLKAFNEKPKLKQ
ncbi:hypothetical protein [Cupriavidus nantongensis]|uniref:hypothetical protein n=1 Tax=Cupriavidus nantongensis TaxID=1796606 RepID=UPI00224566BF|nr:hypothetical protein [Cupriavidus nantongensis]